MSRRKLLDTGLLIAVFFLATTLPHAGNAGDAVRVDLDNDLRTADPVASGFHSALWNETYGTYNESGIPDSLLTPLRISAISNNHPIDFCPAKPTCADSCRLLKLFRLAFGPTPWGRAGE